MIDIHKLEMLDEVIKHCQLAKIKLHQDNNAFLKEVVLANGCIKTVVDALREEKMEISN